MQLYFRCSNHPTASIFLALAQASQDKIILMPSPKKSRTDDILEKSIIFRCSAMAEGLAKAMATGGIIDLPPEYVMPMVSCLCEFPGTALAAERLQIITSDADSIALSGKVIEGLSRAGAHTLHVIHVSAQSDTLDPHAEDADLSCVFKDVDPKRILMIDATSTLMRSLTRAYSHGMAILPAASESADYEEQLNRARGAEETMTTLEVLAGKVLTHRMLMGARPAIETLVAWLNPASNEAPSSPPSAQTAHVEPRPPSVAPILATAPGTSSD